VTNIINRCQPAVRTRGAEFRAISCDKSMWCLVIRGPLRRSTLRPGHMFHPQTACSVLEYPPLLRSTWPCSSYWEPRLGIARPRSCRHLGICRNVGVGAWALASHSPTRDGASRFRVGLLTCVIPKRRGPGTALATIPSQQPGSRQRMQRAPGMGAWPASSHDTQCPAHSAATPGGAAAAERRDGTRSRSA
jgi:hypothetical protein